MGKRWPAAAVGCCNAMRGRSRCCGAHATTKLLKWMVVGVDTDFTHSTPLTDAGDAIGPFTVGQVVKVETEATNSAGTRTSAVRTITIETPIV